MGEHSVRLLLSLELNVVSLQVLEDFELHFE